MKIVFISDTHGKHQQLALPEADMIIHAGDITSRGYLQEAKNFIEWFAALPYQHKIFVAGNHDFCFEKTPALATALVPPDCHYLNDSLIHIEGLQIWGSPVSPYFYNWAFNRHRGSAIQEHWAMIPPNIDILVTHTPPFGVLDKTTEGELVGCEDLWQQVQVHPPRIHAFGHIHEAYGTKTIGNTTFVNASVLNVRYRVAHEPIVLTL